MASILTNQGAMTALMTLRGINKGLGQVQDQISTGKKVATAKDNAASFAIAAVMKADVSGFKALSESLATGSATVGVARAGAETVVNLLEELKGRIVAANNDSADRVKVQADVNALRNQIIETVNASQFNGLNLLQANASDVKSEVLSSLNRSSTGVTSTNIDVYRQSLQTATATDVSVGSTAAATVTAVTIAAAGGSNYAVGDVIAIQLTDSATRETFVLSAQVTAGDVNAGATAFSTQILTKLNNQLSTAEYTGAANFTLAAAAGTAGARTITVQTAAVAAGVTIRSAQTTSGTAAGITAANAAAGQNNFNLTTLGLLDVSSKSGAVTALGAIEGLIQTAVTAASNFGSAQKRIELQSEFVKNITDSLTVGVGALVDADLEAASARLQALQVQQQLGTQSLSIANQAPQNILALFR